MDKHEYPYYSTEKVVYAEQKLTKNRNMNWITIFKREKPKAIMPEPIFEDNWKQERYERNLKEGISALQNGKKIKIIDDGRGYELALEIKRLFILEYQKQLSEKIKIDGRNVITVSLQNEM